MTAASTNHLWPFLLFSLWVSTTTSFVPYTESRRHRQKLTATKLSSVKDVSPSTSSSSRRTFMDTVLVTAGAMVGFGTCSSLPALAIAEPETLEDYLYKIIRVREATQQERRLIKTGKFKDIQRANVKLAVKFMVQNYRLSDCVIGASAYLKEGNNQMKAIDIGQSAVQSLQTILEYFDTSDVENIKVGSDSMAGKESLVLRGLEAAQLRLDDFVSLFPEETVTKVKDKIKEENELNIKEFDRSLGDIINLPPPS